MAFAAGPAVESAVRLAWVVEEGLGVASAAGGRPPQASADEPVAAPVTNCIATYTI